MDEREASLETASSGSGAAATPNPSADPGDPCPWCSSPVAPGATICPVCGAAVRADADAVAEVEIPGLTTIDPEIAALAVRAERRRKPRTAAAITAWITGADESLPPSASLGTDELALQPPSDDVQLEMLRLELESRRYQLEASIVPVEPGAMPDTDSGAKPGDDSDTKPGADSDSKHSADSGVEAG